MDKIDRLNLEVPEKFIINLKGKQFISYEGLLHLGHTVGIKSIVTELVQIPSNDNNNTCIVIATITTKDDEVFTGIGDADPKSTNSMIAVHKIRMAETRAKARALRDLCNIGMTAVEELGNEDDVIGKNNSNNKAKKVDPISEAQQNLMVKLANEKGVTDKMGIIIKEQTGKSSSGQLTKEEAAKIIKILQNTGQ